MSLSVQDKKSDENLQSDIKRGFMNSNHTVLITPLMTQINLLRQTLKPHLGWHGARLNFWALFLIALLRVKTVNLAELATGFRSHAKTESSYKRLQRFFRHFD